MRLITVNYLPWYRHHYFKLVFHFLSKVKESNRNQMHFRIHTEQSNLGVVQQFVLDLNSIGITTDVLMYQEGNNYIDKVQNFCNHDSTYSGKLDEDCFMNNFLWDFIVENLQVLDNPENYLVTPQLSIGIPTIEGFLEDNFIETDRRAIYDTFRRTRLGVYWGVDYSPLNSATVDSSEQGWNPDKYYKTVSEFNHYYRGIHPVRINKNPNLMIHEAILRDIPLFCAPREYSLYHLDRPYLCNSIFFIKTEVWKSALSRTDLYKDAFDEVPLNLYKDEIGAKMLSIRNSHCINTIYNMIEYHRDIANDFVSKIMQKVGI